MRERLKAKRGIIPAVAMVAVPGMVALVSVPWGVAADKCPHNVRQRSREEHSGFNKRRRREDVKRHAN
jgi:hypothetical protein